MRHEDFPTRQQRRAAQRRALSQVFPMDPLCADPWLLRCGDEASRLAEEAANRHLGLPLETSIDLCFLRVAEEARETYPWQIATLLIPFFAHQQLELEGVPSRLVAGSAIWSVGMGRLDTIDHGMQHGPILPKMAAAANYYHLWLESGDHLFDFVARYLPRKLAKAHLGKPFSTPPAAWRRFPQVIVHDLTRAMPDPLRDAFGSYAYRDGGHELLGCVTRSLTRSFPELPVVPGFPWSP